MWFFSPLFDSHIPPNDWEIILRSCNQVPSFIFHMFFFSSPIFESLRVMYHIIIDFMSAVVNYTLMLRDRKVHKEGRLSYADFVWFLISEEDKKTETR